MPHRTTRRQFIARSASAGGAALLGGSWLASFGIAETKGPAKTVVNAAHDKADFDRHVLGSFVEHSVARFTPACTSPIPNWPTSMAFAKT